MTTRGSSMRTRKEWRARFVDISLLWDKKKRIRRSARKKKIYFPAKKKTPKSRPTHTTELKSWRGSD